MKTLRLLLFRECDRACKGCCNKDWDLDNLEVCQSFKGYKEIILTGGEPMLNPALVKATVNKIRSENFMAKVYMYTAKVNTLSIVDILDYLDGLTVTLHEQKDVEDFEIFDQIVSDYEY